MLTFRSETVALASLHAGANHVRTVQAEEKAAVFAENQLLLAELEKFRIRYRGQGLDDDIAVVVQEVPRGLRSDGKYASDLIVKGG